MALRSRSRRQVALFLAGWCLLLLGQQVSPWQVYDNIDKTQACLLPRNTGLCKAITLRWYYDQYSQTCKAFDYGGCGGNGNNFRSKRDCEQSCCPFTSRPSDCNSPKDEGTCAGSITRFYYNKKTKTCTKFLYTGCGGNKNNFVKRTDCNRYCKQGGKKPRCRP